MGIVDIAQEEIPELQIAEEGDNELVIADASVEESQKTGRTYYKIKMKLPNLDNAKAVYHNLNMPMEGDEKDTEFALKRNIKSFVEAFNVSSNEPTDWVGARGWAVLGIEHDETYGDRNKIKRFQAPK